MDILIRLLIILFMLVFGGRETSVPPAPEPETTRQSPTQITDVQAVTLRSFPAQINLTITGYQPDGCSPVQVEQHREGNTVTVDIYRIMPMSVMCPMVLLPYNRESIHLDGSFESGTYTIHVNDFTLEVTV